MIRIQFKCKLLSDLIINQKSASEGPNQTLDFIPGNCFLGIAASSLYKEESERTLELFHSGNIRFSDAHPSYMDSRCLKTPLSLYSPKYPSCKDGKEFYHIYLTDTSDETIVSKQLKQERKGFVCYNVPNYTDKAICINLQKNFALKSAYDRSTRRSEEEKLFGYESLSPLDNIDYFFDIEFDNAQDDNDEIVRSVCDSICGKKRIGRSKSAEYGSVVIERCSYYEVQSSDKLTNYKGLTFATVYADGRLIFLNEEGLPKLGDITAKDLGFNGNSTIRWDKSQVRIFKYAPWNNKRQCFDADRYGFEKGSVFVVQTEKTPSSTQYIGNFKNEGFGRVIYNPEFLKAHKDGRALFELMEMPDHIKEKTTSYDFNNETTLITYLKRQRKIDEANYKILTEVKEWIEKNGRFFKRISPSQWGSIRAKAYQNHNYQSLCQALNDFIERDTLGARVWKDNKAAKSRFQQFYEESPNDDLMYCKIITLASLMAKNKQ